LFGAELFPFPPAALAIDLAACLVGEFHMDGAIQPFASAVERE